MGQWMVRAGQMMETDFIRAVAGSKIRLNRVLLFKQKMEDEEFKVHVGQPYVDGAYVECTVLEHLKGEDNTVWHFKSKKRQMKRKIFQPMLTRFRVDRIVKAADDAPIEGRMTLPMPDGF